MSSKLVAVEVAVQVPPLHSQAEQLKPKQGVLVAQHNGLVQNLALDHHVLILDECHLSETLQGGKVCQEDVKEMAESEKAPEQQEKL